MKIVTWNCAGAFRKKYEKIAALGADIYVIQECENPANTEGPFVEWASNFLWHGHNRHKGLGVFAKPNVRLERLDWPDNDLLLFLPIRVNKRFNLVTTWTKSSPSFRYIGQLWQYLITPFRPTGCLAVRETRW